MYPYISKEDMNTCLVGLAPEYTAANIACIFNKAHHSYL